MSQSFSQNLKRLRTEKNYTQEEAAQFLGVTSQTISRWECGTTLPDVMLLPEIARLYCVTVDDLYNETATHMTITHSASETCTAIPASRRILYGRMRNSASW